jgi:hypothetical protein
MVMVELAPAVTLDGLNDATAPVGKPVALNATDWATPEDNTVLIVLVPIVPADTAAEVGEADIEKLLGGGAPVELALNRAMPDDQYWLAE